MLSITSTCTTRAAATPVPDEPLPPLSLLAWLLLLSTWSCALGRLRSPPLLGLLLTWLSASLSELRPPLELPAALALAVPVASTVAADDTSAAPPTLRLRSSRALASPSITVTTTDAPTAVSLPAASALAPAVTCSRRKARTAASPATVSVPLAVPAWAWVLLVATVTAAATPTPVPPLAPFSVSVTMVCWPFALTVKADTLPLTCAPSSSVASWLRSMMLTPTEAPTPTSLPPAWAPSFSGLARAESLLVDAVVTRSAPPESAPDSVAVAPLAICASVSSFTTLTATEPATPTSPPPAPLLALASVVWVVSPATLVTMAPICRPSATMATPDATCAWLTVLATLMATAAPTASPPSPVVALPSAMAWASVLALDCTDTLPVGEVMVPAAMRARLVDSVMLTATAAATLTVSLLPSSPLALSVLATPADGVADALSALRAPPDPAAELPRPRPAAVFWFTPSSSPDPSVPSSCSPPTALASALAVVLTRLVPATLTAPVPVTDRASSASALSSSTLTVTAAPTAASLLPSALPLAVLLLVDRKSAATVRSPAACSSVPVPMRAMLSWLATVTATTGATAVPPLAPPWAVVTMVFSSADVTLSAPLLLSVAPLASSARATMSGTFTATDAPTPVSLASTCGPASLAGVALALSACTVRAAMLLAPVPALTVAPVATSAVVRSTATLTASAPAMPVLAPPAPLLASAALVWVASAGMLADIVSPWLVMLDVPSTRASFVLRPTFTATATPTPVSLGFSASLARVLPSAVALASWSAVLVTRTAPLEAMLPPPTLALLVALAMFTATAAATLTVPPPVPSADGVAWLLLLLRAPPAAAALSPVPRAAAFWSSTALSSLAELLSSSLPPTALALALAVLAAWLLAVTATPVVWLSERLTVALLRSRSTFTAMAAPTAASLLPSALPSALVVLVDFRLDATFTWPVATVAVPLPMRATASWLATVTATTGATAVSPLAPPSAVVAMVFSSVPLTVSAPLRDSTAPSAISALAMASGTLTATDAPTPVFLASACTPESVGVALALSACTDLALMVLAPLPASTLAPVAISAVVRSTATFTARAPAMPVLAPPAPLLAVAALVWVPALDAPVPMPARTFTPWLATTASPSRRASLVLMPTFTATPTPTPVSLGFSASLARLEPSATALASVSVLLSMLTAPAAVSVPPPAVARLVAWATFTATAAATLTVPPPVPCADGVAWLLLASRAPAAPAAALPLLRAAAF